MDTKQTKCPICGMGLKSGFCRSCGYDESADFLKSRTLGPVSGLSAAERSFCFARKEIMKGARISELFSGRVTRSLLPQRKKTGKPHTTIAAGKIGDFLSWRLDEEGTLFISGRGSMQKVQLNMPWSDYRDRIRQAVIMPGVLDVGNYAFHHCRSLTDVTIPESVLRIGYCAFGDCVSLKSVAIPEGVMTIESYAFGDCTSLESVALPASLKQIQSLAFDACGAIKDVYFAGTEAERWQREHNWESYRNNGLFSAEWHYTR